MTNKDTTDMATAARFDGPHEEVLVIDPVTNKLLATVKRGECLPSDVPAEIREELLARDNWTAVEVAPKTTKKGTE